VATELGVRVKDMKSSRRWASLTVARRVAAQRLREAGYGYPDIGRQLGGMHHTSVMHMLGALSRCQAKSA
jgi:chromosomal replication initiation ATPase DnaA